MGDGHAENGSVQSTLDTTQDLLNSIVYPCNEATSLADHLVITGKGNLKWEGSFEALKDFLNVNQISTTATKWTSPGGGSKLCETHELAIRWYSDTSSLTLKGEKSREVREKLISIVESRKKAKANSSPPEVDDDLHTIDLTNPCAQPSDSIQSDFRIRMEQFVATTTAKIDALSTEVNKLKEDKLSDVLVTALQEEIKMLKAENSELRDKNAIASLAMTDLNTKVKEIENEKKSLITALKILQTEQGNNLWQDDDKSNARPTCQKDRWSRVENRNSKHNGRRFASKTPDQPTLPLGQTNVFGANKFNALVVEETQNDEAFIHSSESDIESRGIPVSRQSRKKKIERRNTHKDHSVKTKAAENKAVQTGLGNQQRRNYPDNINRDESKSKHPTNTVIVGDSILKYLNPRRLQQGINGKATIKT